MRTAVTLPVPQNRHQQWSLVVMAQTSSLHRHVCVAGDAGPMLAAAVADAGGLGFLWAARLPPAQMVEDYRTTISLLEPG